MTTSLESKFHVELCLANERTDLSCVISRSWMMEQLPVSVSNRRKCVLQTSCSRTIVWIRCTHMSLSFKTHSILFSGN